MDDLINKLGINETYTKPIKKQKKFDKIYNNIPHIANYNFMMDILFLPTSKGYKYILTMVDLATDEFDIEPLKSKDAKVVLAAMKKIFKRPYLNKPYSSIRTDAGTEFKGDVHKYLYDQSILHSIALPDRHKQMSAVESLNKQLGRLFNGYMNKIEIETGKEYRNWTDIVDTIRRDLNKIRKKPTGNPFTDIYPAPEIISKPKFKIGDIVLRKVETPYNALGHKQNTTNFRMGDFRWDMVPKKIKQIYVYNTGYRYGLVGINVAYQEFELMKSTEKSEKFNVKQIIGKKKMSNKIYYNIWWKGFKKAESTWELKTTLLADGLKREMMDYDKSN